MLTYQDFCNHYNFKGCVGNADAINIFNYLIQPKTIANMIAFSEIGLPAISGIANILESNYSNATNFPLTDFKNRQITGRMVCFILEHFGYEKVSGGLDKEARLRDFSKTNLFKTSSVYELIATPINTIAMQII
ncbi:MAG: hypothetical protein K2N51_18890 [Lachnospiraceae bacterium]|nr:hypothetical protein [Lachnospiraceae bacterium]